MSTTIMKTAHEVYTERKLAIETKLALLQQKLEVHHQREAASPKNWGFAGNLGHADQVLDELLAFLA